LAHANLATELQNSLHLSRSDPWRKRGRPDDSTAALNVLLVTLREHGAGRGVHLLQHLAREQVGELLG
jgi:hypothetical protein